MMVDVSMLIRKAAFVYAAGNNGAVVQLEDAGGLFVGQLAVAERTRVGSVGAARYCRSLLFCFLSLQDVFRGSDANVPLLLWDLPQKGRPIITMLPQGSRGHRGYDDF